MNSFCLGCYITPTKSSLISISCSSRSPPNQTLSNAESSAVKFSINSSSSRRRTLSEKLSISSSIPTRSRREAIGLGLFLSLVDHVLQPNPTTAAETIPCEFSQAPSGLAFCDKVLGNGPPAEKGQLIKAHYTGKLVNGTVFDSSYNRGKPLTFRIGAGEVIKGWDEGILGGDGVPPMLAGGKRTLKIPPELAYGVRGAGCRGGTCIIPPNSVLLFDVEFVGKA